MSKFVYKIKKRKHTQKYIEKNKLFNVFVFGLPRSGTSMMTHICELLGVKMIHTSEENRNKLDHQYKAKFGDEYHPNPNGFFEITESPLEHFFEIASTPYSGCKMIIPVMGTRWELIKMLPSKVIMMTRNPQEIVESHDAFYADARPISVPFIKTAIASQIVKMRDENVDFIEVKYMDLISNPHSEIGRVRDFIRSEKPIQECVDFVNPELYRQRVA